MGTPKQWMLCLASAFIIISCQKVKLEQELPAENDASSSTASVSLAAFSNGTYQLVERDDFDPLWRFTKSGNSMQFETDPSVTSWGTDYWGYWRNPYTLSNDNTVNYIIGLTNTTYTFTIQADGKVDVAKTLIVNPYLGGSPTTTITHMGLYELQGGGNNDGGDDGDDDGGDDDTGGSGWTTLSLEDFNNGFSNWTVGGPDAGLYTGGRYAHQGSNAAFIQDNSGSSSSIIQQSFDATSFTELEISFWYYAVSMEYGENFLVQFDNGSGNWVTVADYSRGSDFSNNRFYNPVLSLSDSDYNFGSQSRFRIVCDASNNSDDVYIDEIQVRGFN